jgi:hypothetical protein
MSFCRQLWGLYSWVNAWKWFPNTQISVSGGQYRGQSYVVQTKFYVVDLQIGCWNRMVRILALWFSVGSIRTSNNAELVYALLDGTATQSYCGTVVEHWSFLSMATRIFVFWVLQ